jgi:predicted nucleic acid-binding protein
LSAQLAVDTSVAVALLVQTHPDYLEVSEWAFGRDLTLSGHALAETYSVLTRLPGNIRLASGDAAHLIQAEFPSPLILPPTVAAKLPATLAGLGIAGGAVYDAMVGLAAVGAGLPLATRDARARRTYEAVGAEVVVVA